MHILAPFSLLIVFGVLLTVYFFSKEKNQSNETQEHSLSQVVDQKKNTKATIHYDGINVTNVFSKNIVNKDSITNREKIDILEEIGVSFDSSQYQSNSYQEASYGGVGVGDASTIQDIPLSKLKQIINFDIDKVRIQGEIIGRPEKRKSKTVLCNILFSYMACFEDKFIYLNFVDYGNIKQGHKQTLNINNSDNISSIRNQQRDLVDQISNSKLHELRVIGQRGQETIYGKIYYNNVLIYHLEEIWHLENANVDEAFRLYFNDIIEKKEFIGKVEARKPTYKGTTLNWLNSGWPLEKIVESDVLRILEWNDEKLKITI